MSERENDGESVKVVVVERVVEQKKKKKEARWREEHEKLVLLKQGAVTPLNAKRIHRHQTLPRHFKRVQRDILLVYLNA